MPHKIFILSTLHSIGTAIKKADLEYVEKVWGKTIFSTKNGKKKSKNRSKKAK